MIRLTPPEGDLRAGGRGSAEAHQIRAGRLNYRVAPDRSVGQGGTLCQRGNPALSRAHRELALPLRRHKDRPRFGRLHDCGLGELGFAGGHREYRRLATSLAEKDYLPHDILVRQHAPGVLAVPDGDFGRSRIVASHTSAPAVCAMPAPTATAPAVNPTL